VKLGGTVAVVGFPDIGLQGFAPKLVKSSETRNGVRLPFCCYGYDARVAARLCLRFKTTDCRRRQTPDSRPVQTALLHFPVRDHATHARLLTLRFVPFRNPNPSETGGRMLSCHVSCRCHEPRQLRPLTRSWF
jgi:hypothetical protein